MSSILKEMRDTAMVAPNRDVAALLRTLADELAMDLWKAASSFDPQDMRRVNGTWSRAVSVLKIAKGPVTPPAPLAPSVSVEERKAA